MLLFPFGIRMYFTQINLAHNFKIMSDKQI